MRSLFEKLVILCFIASCWGCEELLPLLPHPPTEDSTIATGPDSTIGKWTLVWHDEFNDFNDSQWTAIDGASGINNDLVYHSPDHVTIEDGKLRIRLDDTSAGGKDYTGGKVISKDKFEFTYGRIAVRARTAATYGTHTAAWLLHEPCDGLNPCVGGWPPEIDIVEVIGREPDRVHQTVHYGTTPYDSTTGGRWPDWDFDVTTTVLAAGQAPGEVFHEYVVEWEQDEIRWYIDGVPTKTWRANNTNSFMPKEPMFIILDVGAGGDWAQAPNETSVWPQFAEYDYVRVYQGPNNETDTTQIPDPVELGTYRIRNAASGRYLTADGAADEWLTPFQADLDTSYTTQIWTSVAVEEGLFTLTPAWPENRVLTSDGQQTDAPVYQAAYQGWGSQKWKTIEAGDGTVRLVPQWPEGVTLTTTSNDNWSTIRQSTPTNTDQERWYLEVVE